MYDSHSPNAQRLKKISAPDSYLYLCLSENLRNQYSYITLSASKTSLHEIQLSKISKKLLRLKNLCVSAPLREIQYTII